MSYSLSIMSPLLIGAFGSRSFLRPEGHSQLGSGCSLFIFIIIKNMDDLDLRNE